MDRTTFEALRDLPGKQIDTDIRFSRRQALSPLLIVEGIRVDNEGGVELVLNIHFNPIVGSKTFNVHVPGVGPICRLDLDGHVHGEAGRCHKHSLQRESCPGRNLGRKVEGRPSLAGRTLRDAFDEFCTLANITHTGSFVDSEGVS